jgi:ABC-type hemin transport system ATPase subunit
MTWSKRGLAVVAAVLLLALALGAARCDRIVELVDGRIARDEAVPHSKETAAH